MKTPAITISMPAMFCRESLSLNIIKEKNAVKMGIKLVNTFALDIPMFFTDQAKRINAQQDAKTDSSITGKKSAREKEVLIKW